MLEPKRQPNAFSSEYRQSLLNLNSAWRYFLEDRTLLVNSSSRRGNPWKILINAPNSFLCYHQKCLTFLIHPLSQDKLELYLNTFSKHNIQFEKLTRTVRFSENFQIWKVEICKKFKILDYCSLLEKKELKIT